MEKSCKFVVTACTVMSIHITMETCVCTCHVRLCKCTTVCIILQKPSTPKGQVTGKRSVMSTVHCMNNHTLFTHSLRALGISDPLPMIKPKVSAISLLTSNYDSCDQVVSLCTLS